MKIPQWMGVSTWLIKIAASLAGGLVLSNALYEFYDACPCSGPWLGKLTTNWAIAWMLLAIGGTVLWLFGLMAIWIPEKLIKYEEKIAACRERHKYAYRVIGTISVFIPALVIFYTSYGTIFHGPYLRLFVLLVASFSYGICFTNDQKRLVHLRELNIGILLVGSIHTVFSYLVSVTNYPFALFWSEGNRLYDYSLFFGLNRYVNSDSFTNSPAELGRYVLWGLIYLIPNSPIWLHRLWDTFLWIAPPIAVGYALIHRHKLNPVIKWMFVLWCFVFLSQGPIYAPLLLGALVVFMVTDTRRILLSLVTVVITTYYLYISRFTWVAAPLAWAMVILMNRIDFTQIPKSKLIKKYAGIIGVIIVLGFLVIIKTFPGIINPLYMARKVLSTQPLLWERLLPNTTYQEGIIIGLLLVTGPLIILLSWMIATKKWAKHWIQKFVYGSVFITFLAAGIIISTKIGGGSNLHNLDLFLVTLTLFAVLALENFIVFVSSKRSMLISTLLVLNMLLPSWNAVKSGKPLNLPSPSSIEFTLDIINNKIVKRMDKGEILFLDQRQLLTFHFVTPVPLIQDYEKKDMMNKAMADSDKYFKGFYQDLAKQRFSLIITDPLFVNIQDADYRFDEENNAWVKWVAFPLMCYYAPIYTDGENSVQLLVPRNMPQGCPE